MSKVGKAYIRTDELTSSVRTLLSSTAVMGVYDPTQNEEFSVLHSEFANFNPTSGVMPVNLNGSFVDSPLLVLRDGNGDATDVIFSVPATIPSGTLNIGGVIDENNVLIRGVTALKDSGESFLAADSITGEIHTVPLTLIDPNPLADFGVGGTRVQSAPPFTTSNFGGTDTSAVTVSGKQKIIVTFTQLGDAYNIAQQFRGTKGKMHYRVIDMSTVDAIDTLVYTSEQGDPIDFDSATLPDFEIQYDTLNPNFLRLDHDLMLEFFSADGSEMTMRGQTTGTIPPTGEDDLLNVFIPYFGTTFTFTTEEFLVTEAPTDSKQYTRIDSGWEENSASETVYSPTGLLTALTSQGAIDQLEDVKVDEAPNGGKMYSRKSEAWVEDNALDTTYDNSSGELDATTVQGAIDELSVSLVQTGELINGFSLATSQEPSATDTPLQIEFGAAQGSGSDPLQLLVDGTIQINETGTYWVNVTIQYGRTGQAQESLLHFRALIDGTQIGRSLSSLVFSQDLVIPISHTFSFNGVSGEELTFEIIRDSSENNSGGLFLQTATLAGLNNSSTAGIIVTRSNI